jgi:hypothetical protein
MVGIRITAGLLFATLTLFALDAGSKSLVWQSGQIVSLKEEVSDQDGNWTSYVYSLHGRDRTYSVVTSTPLKAYIRSTIKFAVEKNILYIQDLDGKLRKACLLEPQAVTSPHP